MDYCRRGNFRTTAIVTDRALEEIENGSILHWYEREETDSGIGCGDWEFCIFRLVRLRMEIIDWNGLGWDGGVLCSG